MSFKMVTDQEFAALSRAVAEMQKLLKDHINDTDKSVDSRHHTMGYTKNQVNFGDHRHSGSDGSKSLFGGQTVTGARSNSGTGGALYNLLKILEKAGLVDGTSA